MALTYGQLEAITHSKIIPVLANNVFNKHPFLARLSRPGKKKLLDGGTQIELPIVSSVSTNGAYFSGFDQIDITPSENMTKAVVAWKQLVEPISISRSQFLQNSGDSGKLQLVASKAEIAEYAYQRRLTQGLYSDGTAATGAATTLQLTGTRAVLSTSSTYASIAVADLADWVAQVKGNSGTNRALTLNLLQDAYQSASDGDEQPTVMVMKGNIYSQLWALYQPYQRLEVGNDPTMEKLGFEGIKKFNSAVILVDENMVANQIHILNENFFFLAVHKDEDMRIEKVSSLEKQNAMLTKIFFMGNVICNQRRRQALLSDIEASS